jgi:hypothetical protein
MTFEIGMAYYFMAEWNSAEMWLAKAGKKEAANSEIDYYLADLAARRLDWTAARFHYETVFNSPTSQRTTTAPVNEESHE